MTGSSWTKTVKTVLKLADATIDQAANMTLSMEWTVHTSSSSRLRQPPIHQVQAAYGNRRLYGARFAWGHGAMSALEVEVCDRWTSPCAVATCSCHAMASCHEVDTLKKEVTSLQKSSLKACANRSITKKIKPNGPRCRNLDICFCSPREHAFQS